MIWLLLAIPFIVGSIVTLGIFWRATPRPRCTFCDGVGKHKPKCPLRMR